LRWEETAQHYIWHRVVYSKIRRDAIRCLECLNCREIYQRHHRHFKPIATSEPSRSASFLCG
jgi:hypothetical protein